MTHLQKKVWMTGKKHWKGLWSGGHNQLSLRETGHTRGLAGGSHAKGAHSIKRLGLRRLLEARKRGRPKLKKLGLRRLHR